MFVCYYRDLIIIKKNNDGYNFEYISYNKMESQIKTQNKQI